MIFSRPFFWTLLVGGSLLGSLAAMPSPGPLSPFGPQMGAGLKARAGVLLIAHPHLEDPNFRHAVVLICQHGPEGTVGLILNRPTEVPLSRALPDIPALHGTSFRLFAGGPVQPTGILFLLQMDEQPPNTRPVLDRIYWGGNVEALARVIEGGKPTETFRAYAGHAGWAPGQLESEMAGGAWATLPAEAATIFTVNPELMWSQMLEALRTPRIIRLTRG